MSHGVPLKGLFGSPWFNGITYPPEPRKCSHRSREKSICRSFSDIFGGKLRCPSRPKIFQRVRLGQCELWDFEMGRDLWFSQWQHKHLPAILLCKPWRHGFEPDLAFRENRNPTRRFKLHSKRCVGCFVGMMTWVITYCHQFITCPCSFVCAKKLAGPPSPIGYDRLG